MHFLLVAPDVTQTSVLYPISRSQGETRFHCLRRWCWYRCCFQRSRRRCTLLIRGVSLILASLPHVAGLLLRDDIRLANLGAVNQTWRYMGVIHMFL